MKNSLLVILLLLALNSFSQKKGKTVQVHHNYYKELSFATADYGVSIIEALSDGKQIKFKLKIVNKANTYLFVKPGEIAIKLGKKTIFSVDKEFVVLPNDEGIKVITFKDSALLVDKFSLEIKGIYNALFDAYILRTPMFNLPPTKNEFTIGNITCSLKKFESTPAKINGKFECSYQGDGVGVIDANKCLGLISNGTGIPNSNKNKILVLENGKSDSFVVQFNDVPSMGDLQKKSITINWNDTFRESKLLKLDTATIEMVRDLEKK